jgi:hypothetical protein
MLPPLCCQAAATQHCCRHRRCCAAATATMLPRCCHHTAATATLFPPLRCRLCCRVATKLPPPPLPPRCCHHRHRRHCQAAPATAKLQLSPSPTLWDRFDDEKEFCKMKDVDSFQLSWLFQPGIKFLHGGMLSIFNALVYLSLNRFIFNGVNRIIRYDKWWEIWSVVIIPIQ